MTNLDNSTYRRIANAIRALSMDAVEQAKSGHPGMPMGMADVATILFSEFLHFDPNNPHWPNRDRFILSAGHGSMLLYSLLYLTGYKDITIEDIKQFRQLHAKTAGHPEYGELAAIETTTGPLGQGFANSIGMAIAEKLTEKRFGSEICDHKIYTIAGDGCLMEGISHEAASLAGHLKLGNLVVLYDDNNISIDGPTDLTISENTLKRFKAYGWFVRNIDGHNYDEIRSALLEAQNTELPALIACKTTIAYGAPTKGGTEAAHGAPLGEKEIAEARKELNWPYAPFEIPPDILDKWREIGAKGHSLYKKWEERFDRLSPEQQQEYHRLQKGELPSNLAEIFQNLKKELHETKPQQATRKSSGIVLNKIAPKLPELLGGSADLSGSNETKASMMEIVTRDNFAGRYIHYGVREHAMAAIMNGLALYKNFIPYGGSFLVFTDYCRPAIRLSALMKLRVIYVMTHDSIGLGEDGPTHQPIEHLASLRAIPNLLVLRPADGAETAEAWEIALNSKTRPSVLVLSRQNLPYLRQKYENNNLAAKGAYVISPGQMESTIQIFATGSEVHIAVETQKLLIQQGIDCEVISVPSMELFFEQEQSYKDGILKNNKLKVAIEAAIQQGWERIIGNEGIFIGMNSFGASAPYEDLYDYFGIKAEKIVNIIRERI